MASANSKGSGQPVHADRLARTLTKDLDMTSLRGLAYAMKSWFDRSLFIYLFEVMAATVSVDAPVL